jgi:hypothetical protein
MGKYEAELKRRLASGEERYETQLWFVEAIRHDPLGEWEKMSEFEKIFLVRSVQEWRGKKYQ